jgi:hypothetical protein
LITGKEHIATWSGSKNLSSSGHVFTTVGYSFHIRTSIRSNRFSQPQAWLAFYQTDKALSPYSKASLSIHLASLANTKALKSIRISSLSFA